MFDHWCIILDEPFQLIKGGFRFDGTGPFLPDSNQQFGMEQDGTDADGNS